MQNSPECRKGKGFQSKLRVGCCTSKTCRGKFTMQGRGIQDVDGLSGAAMTLVLSELAAPVSRRARA